MADKLDDSLFLLVSVERRPSGLQIAEEFACFDFGACVHRNFLRLLQHFLVFEGAAIANVLVFVLGGDFQLAYVAQTSQSFSSESKRLYVFQVGYIADFGSGESLA